MPFILGGGYSHETLFVAPAFSKGGNVGGEGLVQVPKPYAKVWGYVEREPTTLESFSPCHVNILS